MSAAVTRAWAAGWAGVVWAGAAEGCRLAGWPWAAAGFAAVAAGAWLVAGWSLRRRGRLGAVLWGMAVPAAWSGIAVAAWLDAGRVPGVVLGVVAAVTWGAWLYGCGRRGRHGRARWSLRERAVLRGWLPVQEVQEWRREEEPEWPEAERERG